MTVEDLVDSIIDYSNGTIRIKNSQKTIQISEIEEVHIVYEQIKYYRNNSKNEQTFQMFTGILDLFLAAKRKFLLYREMECFKLWATDCFNCY